MTIMGSGTPNSKNGWRKLLIPLLLAAAAFGALQVQVATNKEALGQKASKEVIEVQLEAMDDKLDDIINRLQRLEK